MVRSPLPLALGVGAVLALWWSGCVSSDFADGQLLCSPEAPDACPPGMGCVDGRCRYPGTHTGAGGGGAGTTTGGGGSGATAGGGGTTTTTSGAAGGDGGTGGAGASGGGGAGGATPPSCTGLPATCGPQANDDCCRTALVPKTTYYRSYDGKGFTDKGYPATVSAHELELYEVTLGRFRAFVAAGLGTQQSPPAAGAGAHPQIAQSGWNSGWNAKLAADSTALRAALHCSPYPSLWTNTPGAMENRPIQCVSWYEAFAFCAFDGGRLPTEAEWNAAAAGGAEQREYPWGSGIDASKAAYDCLGNGNADCVLADLLSVGSLAPGKARWTHSDLAGNVWEWVLDRYGDYPLPCEDCANLGSGTTRVIRGGGFQSSVMTSMTASSRKDLVGQLGRSPDVGIRCAHDP